ncbi:hypothetical protein M409DRAFT_61933 [Zasmidium cellare ATCC 36951]|uniref:C3H1-type domain-containing protein n=1 Tax=Zasmidium cellare ATCC 36951 TaxID=1080233 RepID=A0A6A6D3F9_ZASCE|nr:uncharacterized protein M409DRAFT_61933 [Zasmidium cellare ATCC 36951]KAF2173585.1 hypothetical protein M409DRAFT_61933 [Zasmidium cellare ATCC 36951]
MHHDRQNGAMPIQRPFPAMQGEGGIPLRMAASPPKNKNTQHVPCKFFLQGQCQAGQMCPFSHDIESTTRPAPCKYFAKGGCKFGRKCALLHITQDGTVVNRMPMAPPAQYYPPQHPSTFGQAPPGLLSMQAQGLEQRSNGDGPQPELEHYQYASRNGYDGHSIDMTYTSASPKYGSPPQNERMATSPPQKGLSVLDAPLPNSFDSNGVSYAARNGPFAASVPSKWDFESPPSSLPRMAHLGNTALRDLHNSAYPERGINNVINSSMGSSPPSGNDEPISFEKRPLHSDRLRGSRALMSASLGTRPPVHFEDSEDDGDTDDEKDLLPSSLHDLIPDGKSRRDSRPRNNEDNKPASFLAAQRRTISHQGTPSDSKAGTPFSSSPSRYSGMFARTAMRDGVGHVGSPLRDSSFPTSNPINSSTNGELSPSVSSPPKQASMSMLTQELQRTKLDAARSVSGPQAPVPSRTLSNGSTGRASMDRALSTNSVGQRIEEDQEVFDMDFEPKSNTNGGFGPVGGGRTSK